ncbi:MAG: FCD domain-containing protein [Propionicimonas sp.]|uniref:FadR/GntR family transcriptional regulator n=1 Tax=Propionicimonas sp. TaxID=1955623 RepID=UPI002B21962F|nr:FCD domain-containing protein [Propionicimonas sp.]MEA4945323.1 FCD domain-containing protein [Propionicimonas sp.]MEA5052837.1 FCD domain-containing protein [Propionicimonas sp.]MEA5117411.1 FCD domain-containing protein [Propionicimonas sp.]
MESAPARDSVRADSVRAYEVVLHHIEAGILEGGYRSGDQLPPERELAAQLNVGRSAVREAMRVLQTAGLITASTGRGGGTRLTPAQGDALARIFRLHLAISGAGINDLTETRVALERASAATAARTGTARTRRELDAVLTGMRLADTVEAFNELDTAFHVLIARAGRNDLVADLTVAIREAVREPIREASEHLSDWLDFRLRLVDEHTGILRAIENGDPDQAAALMEAHIRSAYTLLADTDLTS